MAIINLKFKYFTGSMFFTDPNNIHFLSQYTILLIVRYVKLLYVGLSCNHCGQKDIIINTAWWHKWERWQYLLQKI